MGDTTRVAVDLTLRGASAFAKGVGGGVTAFGGLSRGVSRASADLFHFLQIGKDVFNLTKRFAGGAASLAGALLGPNEQFEVAKTQFTQITGSAEAADKKIRELYDFANNTPFLNPDVVRGGKLLHVFGGEALSSGKNLVMVGDMAAFANQEFSELSTWVGRAYTSMQSGRPFGEAAQRLTEMGLLSGMARGELEDLAKSGATGTDVWDAFVRSMDQFKGSARDLSNTMRGAKSTIQGLFGEIKRLTGEKLFENVKADIIGIRDDMSDAFNTGRIQKFADEAGTLIAKFYDTVKDQTLGEDFKLSTLFDAAEQKKLGDLMSVVFSGAAHNFWQAMRAGVDKHGEDIQRALIPKRLHGILGLGQGPSAAEKISKAAGSPLTALTAPGLFALQRSMALGGAAAGRFGGPAPGGPGTFQPQYRNLGEDIAAIGITPSARGPTAAAAAVDTRPTFDELRGGTMLSKAAFSAEKMARNMEDMDRHLERFLERLAISRF